MPKQRVLIVEDDEPLARVLSLSLGKRGYDASITNTGDEALRTTFSQQPDIVIMDVMLPQMDGWETCRRLKSATDIPVLMVSCRTAEADVLTGFQAGADDYMRKPFTLGELTARVQALLRRRKVGGSRTPSTVLYVQDLMLELTTHRVQQAGEPVHLTPTEFALLACLMRRAGRVVCHQELLSEVWGKRCIEEKQYLMYYVRFLRRKLGDDADRPRYIQTVRGKGYRLIT